MRARRLRLGLYADEQGLAWVRRLVEDAIGSRHARIIGGTLAHTVDDELDFLVEQWTVEHPGQNSGSRQPVYREVHLGCSLRTWRAIRKAVLTALCPEGSGPHICRVPWTVG
ncbi:hypothetical protein OHA91_35145 [Streptomyces erythrochromogenes]|uniref:Uncharacterized protein n=1 Tax=Streptomyces erythrochromogenes TaxID=285574 RepID=A0ABZ1QLK9_9ACTN|nr:hypothetical protein [Streptomyces erythrochromogenes]MCX5589315.1 hypothetical protein [Streptomyces erythrochromogenes]